MVSSITGLPQLAASLHGDDRADERDKQLKHPLALGTDPAPYSAEMAKAARLNSNRFRRPTAKPIDELTTAIREEGAQRLIFDQALRFAPRTPCHQIQASSGLSESCPKNADVPKSPFPCSGSPGAVGRHNNT